MYIASISTRKQKKYVLRESCIFNGELTYRNIFDLGADPSVFIIYPGGNAFYVDETVTDKIRESGLELDSDAVEKLFWPWVRPDIKQAVETFRDRSHSRSRRTPLTQTDKQKIARTVNRLDKRRAHFLKFGNMDQGPVENMPPVIFKHLLNKSRDEIEQYFLNQERILRVRDVKSYVYTIFDLQSFFQGLLAKKMPQALDQKRVDQYFIEELCRFNRELFNQKHSLHPYLVRYLLMFFDHEYGETALLKEMYNDFVFRHHFHNPPKTSVFVSKSKALKIFGIDKSRFDTMDRRSLTKLYRNLAQKHHPDKGGSEEKFIEITDAYQRLVKKM